jgi:glycosyltransferase involved in cell wall biosynthesis
MSASRPSGVVVGVAALTSPARSTGGSIDRADGTRAIHRVAFLGNHLPRQCGIATFTTDLSEAIAAQFTALDCLVLAVNDAGRRHAYPARVRFEIAEADFASYRRAADFLNVSAVDVVSVQHEYGIFGGQAGSHVLALLRELHMPIVTTLHTILGDPTRAQRHVMDELVRLSDRVVVMSGRGAALLRDVHGVPNEKIDRIPHGIPIVPPSARGKAELGLDGKSVILTFGLLSPDKGIEHVIEALPAILARHPETVYVVLGATHPHVKESHGESYRRGLEARARALGVDRAVVFHDRFVSQREVTEFLAAADIYITPYLNPQQIASGTLAYAVGTGRAVISTPYVYAEELLADGRGILVPMSDPDAIGCQVIGLLADDERRRRLGERAARYARDMVWPAVARSYMSSFEAARGQHADRRRARFQAKTLADRPGDLPELDLGHLRAMTDDTGLLQHADFCVPRYDEGYCLDDNARALLLMALIEDDGSGDSLVVSALASRYLAFVRYAFNAERGRFRNFMSYQRRWAEEVGSEDSHGRALWAVGAVVGRSADPGRQSLGRRLFHAGLPIVARFTSPRAWAFTLLGIAEYLRAFQGDSTVQAIQGALAGRLLELFQRASSRDWPWPEERVTYCNARLPHALLVSGDWMRNAEMATVGTRSLDWLVRLQSSDEGTFVPIGSNGFYRRGQPPARFDQQPVEACAMVSACLEAGRLTGDPTWRRRARRAFDWFLGHNQLQRPLYDPSTGGCRDGLHVDRANQNQGAESTLSFLLALFEMRVANRADAVSEPPAGPSPS